MTPNLFFLILNLIFYGLLITFFYFNIVAQNNFSKSNEIIVENSSSSCFQSTDDLKQIKLSDLIPCTLEGQYIYNIPEESLRFVVSTRSQDAGSFSSICNSYCPANVSTNGKCLTVDGTIPAPYTNCIKLLEPPPGCSNSSNGIALDITNDTILYPIRATPSLIC